MIADLVSALRDAGLAATIGDVEQILWLAERLPSGGGNVPPVEKYKADRPGEVVSRSVKSRPEAPVQVNVGGKIADTPVVKNVSTPLFAAQMQGSVSASVLQVPGVTAISDLDGLRRALRPLSRRVPSRWRRTLDEEETAARAAETGIWYPFYRPMRERWLDLSLVVDESPSMDLWAETVDDFKRQLRSQGGFKSVTEYRLPERPSVTRSPSGRRGRGSIARLLDRTQQHVVFFITDGTGFRWRDGSAQDFIRELGHSTAVSIVQLLPRRSWRHSSMGEPELEIFAERPGDTNARLKAIARGELDDADAVDLMLVPVIGLDTATLGQWARMMTALGGAAISGLAIPALRTTEPLIAHAASNARDRLEEERGTAKTRVARYRHMASRSAYDLAVFMSVPDPLTVPVMRLVQRVMLPDTGIQELAEFFLGGLIEKQSGDGNVGEAVYRLASGVREELTRSLRFSEEIKITAQLRAVGEYLENAQGTSFAAYFPSPTGRQRLTDWSLPFGTVSREALHAGLVEPSLEGNTSRQAPEIPSSLDNVREPDLLNEVERPNRSLLYTFASLSDPSDLPAGVKILWVDDIPWNNIYAKDQFEKELGAECTIAVSTAEALERLAGTAEFDVIITDMGRPEGDEAGMDLFAALQKMGIGIPVIIFAARWVTSARNRKRAHDAGVFGATNDGEELFRLVLEASSPKEAHSLIRHYVKALAGSEFFRLNYLTFLQLSPEEAAAQFSSFELGVDEITQSLVEFIGAISQSEYVQLFTLAPDRLPLVASVVAAGFTNYKAASFDGLIGKAAKTGQLVWAPDVSKQGNYINAERSTKSELVIPRTIGGETFVVNIERAVSNAYSDAQIKWLSDFINAFPFPVRKAAATASESETQVEPQRVLVAGSGTIQLPDAVQWLAHELGVRLAESGMHLVAGGWPGVDHIVSRTFTETLKGLGVDPSTRFTQLVEPSQKADFVFDGAETVTVRDWAVDSINQADAVVLIGGLGGTYDIYKAAVAHAKPIVPIAGSGGDAARAAEELQLLGQLPHGNAQSFSSLAVKTRHHAALGIDAVIDQLNRFADPRARERYRSVIAILLELGKAENATLAIGVTSSIISYLSSVLNALPGDEPAIGNLPFDLSTIDGAASALEMFSRETPHLLAAIYFDLPPLDLKGPLDLRIQAAIVTALVRVDEFRSFSKCVGAFLRDNEMLQLHEMQLSLIAHATVLTQRQQAELNSWLNNLAHPNSENVWAPNASSEMFGGEGKFNHTLFPGPEKALQQLYEGRQNTLLVGARGTGKTLVLKLLKQKLEADGAQTLWVEGRASDVPLAVSLALSHARDRSDYADLAAKSHMHSKFDHSLNDRDIAQLQDYSEQVMEQLRAGDVTVLIDDVYVFGETKGWPRQFQNSVFLSNLFREHPSRIVAATSMVIGATNLFGQINVSTPKEELDFRVLRIPDSMKDNEPRAKDVLIEILSSSASGYLATEPDVEALLDYASMSNPRRTIEFLRELEKERSFNTRAVKRVHQEYLARAMASVEVSTSDSGRFDFDRQVRTIVRAVKQAIAIREQAAERLALGAVWRFAPHFEISLADDIEVLAQLVNMGLLTLSYEQENGSLAKVGFLNQYDENWFMRRYDLSVK